MRVKTIDREKLVNRLVDVFASDKLTKEYESAADLRMGICGWNGIMSPLTRCTYIQDFGEAAVVSAETEAREILAGRAEWLANTQYARHEAMADDLMAQGTAYRPAKGDYVWCVTSGLKGEGGLPGEIRSHVYDHDHTEDKQPRLVLLQEVCEITESELMDPAKADQLVQSLHLKGGSCSDDVELHALHEWNKLSDEQKKTFYTFGAAVVTPSGKWYVIDSEGYNYARYIYLPFLWCEVLQPEVDEMEARRRQEIEAEQKREADAKAERLAAYVASCNKWEPLMVDVRPLIEAAKKHQYGTKERKASERAINNACRKNILTMAQTAFPGVKFRLVRHDGWGCDWVLSWIDGPTETEFRAATDLRLFCTRIDTYNGMEDYADVERMEFTDFASKYMRYGGNIDIEREQSTESATEMQTLITEVKPEAAGDDSERLYWSDDELKAIGDHYGITFDSDALEQQGVYGHSLSRYTVARVLFDLVSFYKPQYALQSAEVGNVSGGDAKRDRSHENGESEDAPHESLSLKTMDGGVYVDGSSRATYYNRREIKAHGAKWNKEAQRWEATEPEAIAKLREWFGLTSDQTEPEQPSQPSSTEYREAG